MAMTMNKLPIRETVLMETTREVMETMVMVMMT
jgi:hypothetical protein